MVADGSPHIIWTVFAGRHPTQTINVVGARRVKHDIDVSRRRFTVGLRLWPGVLPALFAAPATRFTDRSIPLSTTSVGTRRRFRASSPQAALDQLLAAVERLVDESGSEYLNVRMFMSAVGGLDTDGLRQQLGLRDRATRIWSHRTLGMNLKRFVRIRRLHTALDMHISGVESSWSRIAADTGYADHSHLVRDCRALLGETPSAFVARADSYKRNREPRR